MLSPTATLIGIISNVIAQAYELARQRLASSGSPVLRMMIQRDHAVTDASLSDREMAVLRGSREGMKPKSRPAYSGAQRLEILQIMRLRGWTIAETAARFVLHANTVSTWLRAMEKEGAAAKLFTAPVWNRIHDAVRWTVQEIRRICPEAEIGTRTIAAMIVRASIEIGRSSVQRILREVQQETPPAPKSEPKPEMVPPAGKKGYNLLAPKSINRVWHLDLTTFKILTLQLTIAAVLDGFSRKLLAIRVYGKVPKTAQLAGLVGRLCRKFGTPRFLITDHGGQFQKIFAERLESLGVKHVRGRVRCPAMAGKIERFFKTLKLWLRAIQKLSNLRAMQRQFENYRRWYNEARCHSALGGRTPEEVWDGVALPKAIPIRQADPIHVTASVKRYAYGGDVRLPVIDIDVGVYERRAA